MSLDWKEETFLVTNTEEGHRVELRADVRGVSFGFVLQASWAEGGYSTTLAQDIITAYKKAEELIAHHRIQASERAKDKARKEARAFEDLI